MANHYHDELGRFCSREKMRAALRRTAESGNVAGWIRLKDDLRKIDSAKNYLPATRMGLIHPAVKYTQSDIEERDEIISRGNREEIQNWVTNRVNNPEFIDLLDERDVMKERSRQLDETYKGLEKSYKKDPNSIDYELVRQKGFESLEAYEEFLILKNQANEYKDTTALAVAALSASIVEEQKANGTYREYTEKTLNDLEETGNFPSGSREWLEQRQKGIGGSDVGKIVGSTGVPTYDFRDFTNVFASKVEPISDEEVERQSDGHTEYTGYAGRGNAWEDYIVHKFSEAHPELNVTHCKTSWQHKENTYQFANFDGLMADENGVPNGILEIKTASDATKWKDTSLGIEGVPAAYKYQALWYADAAGFDKGAIAVVIDDREYREYHFTVTPELKEEMRQAKEKIVKFNEQVEKARAGKPLDDPRVAKSYAGREGFTKTFLDKARRNHSDAFKEASVLRDENIEETKKRYREILGNQDDKDPAVLRQAMVQLYTEKPVDSLKSNFINVDIETTSTSQTAGHIIEVGISVRSPKGEELEKFSKLYGLPSRALKAQSTGAVEVHGITEGMIAKKRTFQHKEEQRKVLETLKSGILVAHNAPYELKWFRQKLDGFAEAEAKGEIRVIDTKNIVNRVLTDTPNARLSSFAEYYDIPYEDAHRAYNDSVMMSKALTRFLADPFKKKTQQ